jgi:hypothetical protein
MSSRQFGERWTASILMAESHFLGIMRPHGGLTTAPASEDKSGEDKGSALAVDRSSFGISEDRKIGLFVSGYV